VEWGALPLVTIVCYLLLLGDRSQKHSQPAYLFRLSVKLPLKYTGFVQFLFMCCGPDICPLPRQPPVGKPSPPILPFLSRRCGYALTYRRHWSLASSYFSNCSPYFWSQPAISSLGQHRCDLLSSRPSCIHLLLGSDHWWPILLLSLQITILVLTALYRYLGNITENSVGQNLLNCRALPAWSRARLPLLALLPAQSECRLQWQKGCFSKATNSLSSHGALLPQTPPQIGRKLGRAFPTESHSVGLGYVLAF